MSGKGGEKLLSSNYSMLYTRPFRFTNKKKKKKVLRFVSKKKRSKLLHSYRELVYEGWDDGGMGWLTSR